MSTVLGGKDYYRTLQVHSCAHPEVIKTVYRTLMLRLGKHPDRGGDLIEAQAINEAYDVLSDPARRAQYDQLSLRTHHEARGSTPPSSAREDAPRAKEMDLLLKIRASLAPHYRDVQDLPLAAAFDLLLEGQPPFKNRLMFTVYDRFTPRDWSRVFGLFRLVTLHRSAWLPRADAVVVVANEVLNRTGFLKESLRRSSISQWTWGPRTLALLEGGHLHSEFFLYLSPPLAELRAALAV